MWQKNCSICWLLLIGTCCSIGIRAHEAKDFDDAILYKIDFEVPDFEKNPELKNNLKTFYTNEKEKYDCVIPVLEEMKEELVSDEPERSPLTLLQPLFTAPSCSFRIEAYWSYEICHGRHVRQYHEEREGKTTKFQEYYLGQWNEDNTENIQKSWEEDRKAGKKYKTTKIENTKYPYFEMELSDGTMCDINNEPRSTTVRYICYPHGKNEIYSFKETSSCHYEAIILTSALCLIPAFHPEETKEVSIKCYNSPEEPHKPLSMLRQELNDLQLTDADIPISRRASMMASAVVRGDRYMFLDKANDNVDQIVLELISGNGNDNGNLAVSGSGGDSSTSADVDNSVAATSNGVSEKISENESSIIKAINTPLFNLAPIKDFISGKNCLTGGTGWWRYEFCYGRYVRQFHKDKNGMVELYLGYFSPESHRHWVNMNPEKSPKHQSYSLSLWHHYEKGTMCDRTDQPREVDVKLTCMPLSTSPTTVSMYLLEPKTCQYTLVVESPIICSIMSLADDYGLVDEHKLQQLLVQGEHAQAKQTELAESIDGIAAKGDAHQQSNQEHQQQQKSNAESMLNGEART